MDAGYEQDHGDHSPELRYDMGFTAYPVTSAETVGGLSYQDYDWTHAAAAADSRPLYQIHESIEPQYGSYIGYSGLPSADMGVIPAPTYIQTGEMSFGTPLTHLPSYTGHENFYNHTNYNSISPSSSACSGSSGNDTSKSGVKPKRKRVQSMPQRRAANVRERRRMFHLNEAFDELRKRLPAFNYEKRLSRIETLRLAMTYIAFMKNVSDGKDPKEVKLIRTTTSSDEFSEVTESD